MNIKIDTTNKIIAIEDSVVLMGELINELDKLIPNWREYKLEGVRVQWFQAPTYYPTWVHPIYNPLSNGTFVTCLLENN